MGGPPEGGPHECDAAGRLKAAPTNAMRRAA
jgi:hypothetical protein